MVEHTDNITHLGDVEKIALGQGFCYIVNGQEIAVFRPRSGGLFAIENRCPHRQGPLADGVTDSCSVICPYHGHKFDLKTGQGGEAGEQVKTFEVWDDHGKIAMKLS